MYTFIKTSLISFPENGEGSGSMRREAFKKSHWIQLDFINFLNVKKKFLDIENNYFPL